MVSLRHVICLYIQDLFDFLVTIDLCDEKGSMKKLFENPESYANEYLAERGSFILIKVESKFTRRPSKVQLSYNFLS